GTIWFSLGSGMLFWWMIADIDFDTWLRGSAVTVSLGVLATFVRWRKKQQAMQAIPTMPVWTPPKPPANDNRLVTFSLHAKRESYRTRRDSVRSGDPAISVYPSRNVRPEHSKDEPGGKHI